MRAVTGIALAVVAAAVLFAVTEGDGGGLGAAGESSTAAIA